MVPMLLLALHFALALSAKWDSSTTSDELAHLTAGVSYWRNNDYRMQPENGNLSQRWGALPLWLSGAELPSLEGNKAWRASDVWLLGYDFFYRSGKDHFPRLMSARAMIALLSVATGLLVFTWSRSLFGNSGAIVSLVLFTFSPEFLAHGALATSDACMALLFLAASKAWWDHLHSHSLTSFGVSAITLGAAMLAKFSSVLLLPMLFLMAVVRAFAPQPLVWARRNFSSISSKAAAMCLSASIHALACGLIIWAFYGFRFSAFNSVLPPASDFLIPWKQLTDKSGLPGQIARLLAQWKLLPAAFLYGFEFVLATSAGRPAFLNGAHSITGWPSFFLWTFLWKSTPPLLIFTAWLGVRGIRNLCRGTYVTRNLYPYTPLLALFGVYWVASLTSHLNIGHRHILPIYPVLFIATGSLGQLISNRRWWPPTIVAILCAWHVAESLRIYPHHLAYFNSIAGGPANGWRRLVDSSLDWGQDLPTLAQWLSKNGQGQPQYLAYFGTGDPSYYGIQAARMTTSNESPTKYFELQAGIYCVSATILQQVHGRYPGPWTAEREREFQDVRRLEPLFAALNEGGARRDALMRDTETPETIWRALLDRHAQLRMGRLAQYLQSRSPEASAGYSILIYRLSPDDVKEAMTGVYYQWSPGRSRNSSW